MNLSLNGKEFIVIVFQRATSVTGLILNPLKCVPLNNCQKILAFWKSRVYWTINLFKHFFIPIYDFQFILYLKHLFFVIA